MGILIQTIEDSIGILSALAQSKIVIAKCMAIGGWHKFHRISNIIDIAISI